MTTFKYNNFSQKNRDKIKKFVNEAKKTPKQRKEEQKLRFKKNYIERVKILTNHSRLMLTKKKSFWKKKSKHLVTMLMRKRVHLGQHKRYARADMRPFILSYVNDFSIINLEQTVIQLRRALGFAQHCSYLGSTFLLVSTNLAFSSYVEKFALELDMPYLTSNKWIGGGLTNNQKLVKYYQNLELKRAMGQKLKSRRLESIHSLLDLGRIGAVVVLNPLENADVVNEARVLGLPVIGLCDTHTSTKHIDYPIVCNNESLESVYYILQLLYWAVSSGNQFRVAREFKKKNMKSDNYNKKNVVKKTYNQNMSIKELFTKDEIKREMEYGKRKETKPSTWNHYTEFQKNKDFSKKKYIYNTPGFKNAGSNGFRQKTYFNANKGKNTKWNKNKEIHRK